MLSVVTLPEDESDRGTQHSSARRARVTMLGTACRGRDASLIHRVVGRVAHLGCDGGHGDSQVLGEIPADRDRDPDDTSMKRERRRGRGQAIGHAELIAAGRD